MRTRRQQQQKIQEKLQQKVKILTEQQHNPNELQQESKNIQQIGQLDQIFPNEQEQIQDEIISENENLNEENTDQLQLIDIENLGKKKKNNYKREKGFVYSKKECTDAIIRIKNTYFQPNNTMRPRMIDSYYANIYIQGLKYHDYESFSLVWRSLQSEFIVQNKLNVEKYQEKMLNQFHTHSDNWLVRALQQKCLDLMNGVHKNLHFKYWTLWKPVTNKQFWLNQEERAFHKTTDKGCYIDKASLQPWSNKQTLKYIGEEKQTFGEKIHLFKQTNNDSIWNTPQSGCPNCYRFLEKYKKLYDILKIRLINLKRLQEYKLFRQEIIVDMFEQFFDKIMKQENNDYKHGIQVPKEILEVQQEQLNQSNMINEQKLISNKTQKKIKIQ
ncbi:hypothetical protein PPERSA_06978 [Pseudocohnilembus persalinus]|uniref:Uncharacterized protein n=1 Tax=Pseudocohnilembus persalinus TaxID=266149 RepID=A0A0V0QYD5_PSEPJ|nr:hypothetical protein PPERSA_06978 [Pseudocohnilembus persalinus]|eukprot:KRX07363.1 hypothetical protein PPERSA_06978 [Pseudocohnilembus persalinus]